MIVFLISGIWHGANWTFILWGFLHGVLSVLERIFDKEQKKFMEAVRWWTTFVLVNMLWLLFRSDSIEQWRRILGKMLTFEDTYVTGDLILAFNIPEFRFFNSLPLISYLNREMRGLCLLLFMAGSYLICLIFENNYRKLFKNNYATMIIAAIAFIWSFLCLSSESVFVYFNF